MIRLRTVAAGSTSSTARVLAALVPAAEAEAEAGKQFIALQARLINKMMKQLLSTKHNSVIICTNQLREQIGYGPADPMPGGRGQNFFTSLLLRTKREGWIEEHQKRVGFNIKDRSIEAGVISQKGPWYKGKVGTVEIKQMGKSTFIDWLKENPKVVKSLEVIVGQKQDK